SAAVVLCATARVLLPVLLSWRGAPLALESQRVRPLRRPWTPRLPAPIAGTRLPLWKERAVGSSPIWLPLLLMPLWILLFSVTGLRQQQNRLSPVFHARPVVLGVLAASPPKHWHKHKHSTRLAFVEMNHKPAGVRAIFWRPPGLEQARQRQPPLAPPQQRQEAFQPGVSNRQRDGRS
ncbi:unnamed protein product, partial [Pylaiella littoralis]